MSKNPIQPDVSPRPRKQFDKQQVIISVVLLVLIIGGCLILFGFLDTSRQSTLDAAIARATEREETAKQKELDFINAAEAVRKHEEEVATRERKLEKRATDLATREAELETNIEALKNEKIEFYASQSRVYTLTSALAEELAPGMGFLPLEEDETNTEETEEPEESVRYTDSGDSDIIIEEVTVE